MGFSDTLKDIGENLIDGAGAIFGLDGGGSHRYPTEGDNFDANKITNIPKFNNGAWRSSLGYSFKVVRVKDETAKDDENWKEFRLQINPQELTEDEIFAIEVTPTFRGVLVEHHGITLKDITLSGTTGVSPFRREGGAFSKTGAPIFSPGHSGYEEFHELRSYFRVYVEQKRVDRAKNGELRMIFNNFKDEESLYVEPQKFTMKRSASRPMMYNYSIQLKAIGVADAPSEPEKDIFQKIIDVVNTVSDGLADAERIIEGGIGFIQRTERDVVNTILGPLRSLSGFLDAFKKGQDTGFGLSNNVTRSSTEGFKNEVTRVEANLNEAYGIDLTSYNAATGRVSTLQPQTLYYQDLPL